eukprot:2575639-Alexandrium_andersonii.AAC.1
MGPLSSRCPGWATSCRPYLVPYGMCLCFRGQHVTLFLIGLGMQHRRELQHLPPLSVLAICPRNTDHAIWSRPGRMPRRSRCSNRYVTCCQ